MINLLPPEHQHQLRAARVNVLLIRYVILSLAAVLLLVAAAGASFLILSMTKSSAESVIADSNQKASEYQSVDAEAKEFKSNLQTAKTILDKEVRYSQVLVAIAQTLPKNTVLESIALDATNFGTPTTLSAQTKSYEDALVLKSSLEESDIFSNVHLESITSSAAGGADGGGNPDGGGGSSDSEYPISVSINVTINKEVAQ